MKNRTPLRRNIVVALTLVAISAPAASTALFGSLLWSESDPFAVQGRVRERAIHNRENFREQRRAYERALDFCREERIRTGEEIECPDFNDADSYREFIDDPQHGAAPSVLEQEDADLDVRDRALLEQYVQQGRCPARLASQGLYTRCVERLDDADRTSLVGGFLNDRVVRKMNEAMGLARTLRSRLEQVRAPRTYNPATLTGSTRRR